MMGRWDAILGSGMRYPEIPLSCFHRRLHPSILEEKIFSKDEEYK
jgi:hypothetical protein